MHWASLANVLSNDGEQSVSWALKILSEILDWEQAVIFVVHHEKEKAP